MGDEKKDPRDPALEAHWTARRQISGVAEVLRDAAHHLRRAGSEKSAEAVEQLLDEVEELLFGEHGRVKALPGALRNVDGQPLELVDDESQRHGKALRLTGEPVDEGDELEVRLLDHRWVQGKFQRHPEGFLFPTLRIELAGSGNGFGRLVAGKDALFRRPAA